MPGKILDYCKCPMPVKTEEDMQGNQIKHAFISTKKNIQNICKNNWSEFALYLLLDE